MMPRCKHCREKFVKKYFIQPYCLLKDECITAHKDWAKAEIEKKANKEFDAKHKPSAKEPDNKKALQDGCNKLARMIDIKFWNCCIDCSLPFKDGKEQHGAHFSDVGGHNSVRYNLHNIHAATSQCNKHSSKHKTGYRIGLEERYGKEYLKMVDELPSKYQYIKISSVELIDKVAIVRKLIRTFDTFSFSSAIQAREQLNKTINIYE